MTVSTAPTPLSYDGNGSTTAFPISWKYNAMSHVVATLRSSTGTETVWALTTNYTLTDPDDTGTLTAVVAPATGETLVITLEPPNTQSSDIPLGGAFPSATVENGLDLAAQRDAKIQALFDRALRVPKTDTVTGSSLELPIDTDRASMFLAFDADGVPIAAAGTSADLGPVSVFINTLLDDTTEADARTTLGALESDFSLLTAETAPDAADLMALRDSSAGTTDKVTLTVLSEAIRALLTAKSGAGAAANYSLSAAVAANALTITLSGADAALSATNKAQFTFRSATAATGTPTTVDATADLTLTISSDSTLGTTSAVPARFWVVLFNDAGTLRLGVINCSTSSIIYPIADDMLASSTAEGGAGAADSAGVIYTGSAVTAKAMRVLGYVENTQATAGTYATTPSKVQLWQPGMKLPGDIVQTLRSASGAVATGTTVLPIDDTIPQNTEGDQYFSQAITPTAAVNHLIVQSQIVCASTAGATLGAALFQDTTADALASQAEDKTAAHNAAHTITLDYRKQAGATTATTFKVRAGGNAAGTFTLNGVSGGRLLGGTMNSFLEVREMCA